MLAQLSDRGWIEIKAAAIGASLLHLDLVQSAETEEFGIGEPDIEAEAECLAGYLHDLCARARPELEAEDDLEQKLYDIAESLWRATERGGVHA